MSSLALQPAGSHLNYRYQTRKTFLGVFAVSIQFSKKITVRCNGFVSVNGLKK